jgi:hypothetical protein
MRPTRRSTRSPSTWRSATSAARAAAARRRPFRRPTTTVGGTTTTVGGGGNTFTIGFDLVEAVNIGALQFSVDYSGAPGGFDGAADTVLCSDKTGSLASFNDNEATSTLSAGFINLGGFTGPRQVATCTFTSTGAAPVPGDFVLTVEDAAQPDLTPIFAVTDDQRHGDGRLRVSVSATR